MPSQRNRRRQPEESQKVSSCHVLHGFTFPLVFRLLRGVAPLGQQLVVAIRFDFPPSHHGVIFVNHVVAMQRIAAVEVAEAEEQLHPLRGLQPSHIFSGVLDLQRRRGKVPRDDLMLLEVDVDRVRPVAGDVLQYPVLRAVLLNGKTDRVAVDELAVDRPLAVQTVEAQGTGDARLDDFRQIVELLILRCGALVLNGSRVDVEAQYEVAFPCGQNLRRGIALSVDALSSHDWALTVDLVEAVLQHDRLAGELAEVDDDFGTLGDSDAHAFHLHRLGEQVAVVGDHKEWIARTEIFRVSQEELIEARRPGVEQAEAITPRLDLEKRLNLAVDQELVAQNSVEAEQIESQQSRGTALRIEQLVGKHHGNVKLGEAGKAEAGGFVTGIEIVEQQISSDEPFVAVLGSMVEAMVVIEERTERLVDVAGAGMRGENTSEDIGIMLVVEMSALEKVAGKAVTFRRRVSVVQMGRDGVESKTAIFRWKVVDVANQVRFAVARNVGRTRKCRAGTVVESPHGLQRKFRVQTDLRRTLCDLVELLGGKQLESLMRARALLSRGGVGINGRRGGETGHRRGHRHDRHRLDERGGRRAGRLERGHADRV